MDQVHTIEKQYIQCNFTSGSLITASYPEWEGSGFRKLRHKLNVWFGHNTPSIVPLISIIKHGKTDNSKQSKKSTKTTPRKQLTFENDDDLKPGDYVQVRSEEEIQSTLNEENKFKGLGVMPEMTNFYGKKYQVLKKVNKIMIEDTGELRIVKSPTYLLEGVICDGEYHMNCDRSCFLLWKREWLKKL